MNSENKIMQVENPQLVGREQIAVYVPVDEILDGMAEDPDERFKGDKGDPGQEGVGIMSISVGANNNLVIQLTNGNTYNVDLPSVEGNPGSSGGGTKITVGGIEVSEWNADTKLDKITSTGTYDRAYVVTAAGTNTTYDIYQSPVKGAIVRRRSDYPGIKVELTPRSSDDAASKQYVDTKTSNVIPHCEEITYNVTVDSIASVPTLSFPYTTFRPTTLSNVYPFIIGKLIFFIDDMYLASIDVPFGGGMYGAAAYVQDAYTPQTGTIRIEEDYEGTAFLMTDEEGTFVQDMINMIEDEMYYVRIFIQY